MMAVAYRALNFDTVDSVVMYVLSRFFPRLSSSDTAFVTSSLKASITDANGQEAEYVVFLTGFQYVSGHTYLSCRQPWRHLYEQQIRENLLNISYLE